MTASANRRKPAAASASQARRALTIIRFVTTVLPLAAGITLLIVALAVLLIPGAPSMAFRFIANLPTTTVGWPNPDTMALRERTERQFPPPPASSFETATITTYMDGDKWKCVRYRTDASAADTRAYYTKLLRDMKYGISDGYGYDGPYTWQLSVIAMDGAIRLTPWDGRVPMESAPPPYRVAVCFIYEPWTWPKVEKPPIPTTTVYWPHPEVVAWREKVEAAFPPDPSWTFSSATMITRPNGYHWDCITYNTGWSEADGLAYYDKWLPGPASQRSAGPPYLVKARNSATDGTVTICPYFSW